MNIKIAIECYTQDETTKVLNKIYDDLNLNWYGESIHPAECEIQKRIFENNSNEGIVLCILDCFPDDKYHIGYLPADEAKISWIKKYTVSYLSANEYLDFYTDEKAPSFGYDVYDDNSEYVRTLYSEDDLKSLISEAQSSGKTFFVYTSKEECINGDYDINNSNIIF